MGVLGISDLEILVTHAPPARSAPRRKPCGRGARAVPAALSGRSNGTGKQFRSHRRARTHRTPTAHNGRTSDRNQPDSALAAIRRDFPQKELKVPSAEALEVLPRRGDTVKICESAERFWVSVTSVTGDTHTGHLSGSPS